MRKFIVFILFCLMNISIAGCGTANTDVNTSADSSVAEEIIEPGKESEDSEMSGITNNNETLDFMMDTYGLTEDELAGYDLERLMADYDFRNFDYTTEEIREILSEQGKYYLDTGYTSLFSSLDIEEGGKLSEGSDITRISFYYNEGTLIKRIVYDLAKKEIYNDSVEPIEMTNEQFEHLKTLASDNNIYEWDNYYEGDENPTTGNLRWKLAFDCSDGNVCVYGGYTQDMSHLPQNFLEVSDILLSMIDA